MSAPRTALTGDAALLAVRALVEGFADGFWQRTVASDNPFYCAGYRQGVAYEEDWGEDTTDALFPLD